MTNRWEAEGKTFLITGGASGLGAKYAETFLQLGAKRVALLDISVSVGENFVASLNETYPGKVIFVKCDVGNEDDITTAFEAVLNDFQRIDVIINNAGIMSDAAHLWSKSCDVNWRGLVSFTLKGVEHMRKDEGGAGGTIINISSTAALIQIPTMPIYSASKMAVLNFSYSLSELAVFGRTGVRILTMCFGPTATPLMENILERAIDKKLAEEFYSLHEAVVQDVESAVNALVKMFEEGSSGSIWLSKNNEPVQNITEITQNIFAELKKIAIPT